MKRVRLIALDMDGTLLLSDHQTVPQQNIDAIRRADAAGIRVCICTGRMIEDASDFVKRLNLPCMLIACNGTRISDAPLPEGRILYRRSLEPEDAKRAIDLLMLYHIMMNGFEDDFVPKGSTFTGKRKRARSTMLRVANSLLGQEFDDDTLIIGTSGRYEFKNKGIDVFLESLNRLNRDKNLNKKVLAFVNVPGWVGDPREDLQQRLKKKDEHYTTPLEVPFITHWLHNMTHDQVLDMLKYLGMGNRPEDKVKVIFVPCYLDGKDGILNKHYYDLILGEDLSVYPSYYEPWGYTPLESVAFRVPTITTDLAGFGLWVNSLKNQHGINDGVEVLHRSDYNYSEVADGIKDTITLFSTKTDAEIKEIRKRAAQVAEQALWKHFIQYYYEAYDLALRNAMKRQLG